MNRIKKQTELAVKIGGISTNIYDGLSADDIRAAFSPEEAGIRPEKPSLVRESTLEEQQMRTSYGI